MKQRQVLAYGLTFSSVGIALFLSLLLEAVISRTIGAFFYIAIAITTWYGGLRPGLVAIVLSVLALDYYFILPTYQFQIYHLEDALRLALFVTVSLVITLLSTNLRSSRRKVEQLNQRLLDESDDRLRTALNAAQMGLWDWNIVTGEINWSPEHERLFDLSPGSFDGSYQVFDHCLHPDDRAGLSQAINQALQHRLPYHHEYRIVWADGSIHWIEGRGHAFYNAAGEPVRMSGTVMAIDDRHQLESALKQSEQQFRTIFEAEPECILTTARK